MTSRLFRHNAGPTLIEANPNFLSEWDYKRNGEKSPSDYTTGSDCKIWWRCRANPSHSWEASLSHRSYGKTGCPYCSGRSADASNCLAETHPDIATQWHPTKNNPLQPTDVTAGSHKKIHWICARGHEWQAVVYSRKKNGCPYCRGLYATLETSLASLRPDIAEDWHPEKNGSLTPADVTLGSEKSVWWRCRRGHDWSATVQNRSKHESGCPKCTSQTSRPELRLFCELRTIFPDVSHRTKIRPRLEVDLLIPLLKVIVQFDGKRFHATSLEKDQLNTNVLEELGFYVVRIRDVSLPEIGRTLAINEKYGLSLSDIQRLLILLNSVTSSIADMPAIQHYLRRVAFAAEANYVDLCSVLPGPLPGSSLLDQCPDIAAMWHVEKNGRLTPADVTPNSNIKVFWRCDRHDAYFGSISGRVGGCGCTYCARRTVLPEDSLEQLHPELAMQFHQTKNGDVHPSQIAPGSGKKYWWRCSKSENHEWEATVQSRVNGCGCSICHNKKIIRENSLAALAPIVASQWHFEKNHPLLPELVGTGSHKSVWWICPVDSSHEWPATIKNRTRVNSGCPYCDGKKTDPKRSLAAIHPQLAHEWHQGLNDRTADSVLPGSGYKAWWQCQVDSTHVWQARVESRKNGHKKCPWC